MQRHLVKESESHGRWDLLGEFWALVVSLKAQGLKSRNAQATLHSKTLIAESAKIGA